MDRDEPRPTADRLAAPPPATPAIWSLRLVYTAAAGILKSEAVRWSDNRPLGIGRRKATTPDESWLPIADENVSREHARLVRDGRHVLVEDLGSKNGSAVNSGRLQAGQPWPLRDGDLIRFGDSFFIFRLSPHELDDAPVSSIIGVSSAACAVRCAIVHGLKSAQPILILGESGTGKDLVAQAIHQGKNLPGKLIAVKCQAIPESLLDGLLFGTEKEASSAVVGQPGLLQEADRGTLFLDEIGDLSLDLQRKLVRAIDARTAAQRDGTQPSYLDVQILAASTRSMDEALHSGHFSEDLYERFAHAEILLPPLRQRREDILLLAQHFGGPTFPFSPRIVAAMLAYSWPQNIREMASVVARLRTHSEEEIIRALAVAPPLPTSAFEQTAPPPEPTTSGMISKEQIIALLIQHRGNLSQIEARHGYSRRQFRRWIVRYGIDLALYRS